MTALTAGPWKQDKIVGNMIWAGEMRVADIRGWGHLTGKGALGLSDGDAIDIQNANARLIAAAPDLLGALEKLLASQTTGNMLKASMAIAKAKGE